MQQKRFYSLDVFRGATVALMILVNNPGTWSAIYPPLRHASWHGLTPTDLVFPFFLFAVGNAMAFVMPRLRQNGSALFWRKILKRSLLIFLIGLLLNWWPFFGWQGDQFYWRAWTVDSHSGVRIPGVLQRIAVAYFFAAIIAYYLKEKKVFILSFVLLAAYWLLTKYLGTGDPYSLECFVGTRWDLALFGPAHVYHGEGVAFDPEGLFSTLPCIPQVLFGYLAGNYIIHRGTVARWNLHFKTARGLSDMLSGFMTLAVIAAVIAYFWQLDFPLNKKIWSSSYVLLTTSFAMLSLGVLIWYIEILGHRTGIYKFFEVFGKNPLFIYALSELLPLTSNVIPIREASGNVTTPFGWFYNHLCAPLFRSPELSSLLFAILFVVFCWLIAWGMDRRKIYIKV